MVPRKPLSISRREERGLRALSLTTRKELFPVEFGTTYRALTPTFAAIGSPNLLYLGVNSWKVAVTVSAEEASFTSFVESV